MKYLIFCLALMCVRGQCLEIPFSEKTAADYYRSADLIIIGTKVGGSIDYSTYITMASMLEAKDEDVLRKRWKALKMKSDDFLVLKVYIGEAVENDIIELDQSSDGGYISVTETAIIFVRDDSVVGWCDSFDLRNFSAEELMKMVKFDKEKLINFLIKGRKHTCLNPPTMRFDSEQ